MKKTKQEKLLEQLAKEEEREARKQAKKKPKKEKPQKIEKNGGKGKVVLAVILWILLIGVFAYGVFSLATRQDSQDIKEEINGYYTELNKDKDMSGEISSFAENFVVDYYTKADNQNNYSEKVEKYFASGITPEDNTGVNSTVVSTKTIRTSIEDDRSEVIVRANINYKSEDKDGKVLNTMKTLDICVPIKEKDGDYAVSALPYYVAFLNNANAVEADNAVDDSDEEEQGVRECKTLAKNFLNAYYGTKASELKYFVTENYGRVITVGNGIKFSELSACEVSETNDGYTVLCSYVITNEDVDEMQQMTMNVVEGAEGRLYVDSISAR